MKSLFGAPPHDPKFNILFEITMCILRHETTIDDKIGDTHNTARRSTMVHNILWAPRRRPFTHVNNLHQHLD